jgi:hypothetical protein
MYKIILYYKMSSEEICSLCNKTNIPMDSPNNSDIPTECTHYFCTECWTTRYRHCLKTCPVCNRDISNWLNSHYPLNNNEGSDNEEESDNEESEEDEIIVTEEIDIDPIIGDIALNLCQRSISYNKDNKNPPFTTINFTRNNIVWENIKIFYKLKTWDIGLISENKSIDLWSSCTSPNDIERELQSIINYTLNYHICEGCDNYYLDLRVCDKYNINIKPRLTGIVSNNKCTICLTKKFSCNNTYFECGVCKEDTISSQISKNYCNNNHVSDKICKSCINKCKNCPICKDTINKN